MSDVLEALGSSALDFGFGVAGMGVQNLFARANAEAANRMAQQNQVMAPVNYVSGLRQAGLPVSLATKGAFQPAAAPAASQPSLPSLNGIGSNVLSITQARQAEAGANLTNTEERIKAEELRNLIDERITFDASIRGIAEQESSKDSPYASMWSAILRSNDTFSSGTYSGLVKVVDLLGRSDDSVAQALRNQLSNAVYRYQLDNNFAKILGDIPKVQQAKVFADLSKVYADIFKTSVDSRVSEETIKKVVAETTAILTEAGATAHRDFVGMIKQKDYFGAFLSLGYSALNSAAGLAPLAVMPGRKLAPTTKKAFDNLAKLSPFPHPEGYRRY